MQLRVRVFCKQIKDLTGQQNKCSMFDLNSEHSTRQNRVIDWTNIHNLVLWPHQIIGQLFVH
jgi:hypothetical protein